MKIAYLKKLEENKTIGGKTIEGVSEQEIEKVERKFNIKFPQAYKEYLYLAGEYPGNLPMLDTADLETISADWHMEIVQEEIEESKLDIKQPFWLFAEGDGCEVFFFFYLNDSDDNPVVYFVNHSFDESGVSLTCLNRKFSEFISDKIDQAYRYEKEGY